MSFLEGVGSPLPAAPREISVRAGARSGLGVRPGGGRSRGCPGFRPSCGPGSLRPLPAPSCPPSPPRGVALVASLPAVPGLWNSCVCKLPREGRGCALVRRARGPLGQSGGVPRPGRGGPREAAPASASAWTPAPWSRVGPWQHPEMGGKKTRAIAEGEERGKMWVPSAPLPLSGRRDSMPGLGLGPACAGRVGGGRGSWVPRGLLSATCSDGARSAASYPRAGAGIAAP